MVKLIKMLWLATGSCLILFYLFFPFSFLLLLGVGVAEWKITAIDGLTMPKQTPS